ncbi:MAG TPA: rhomboid family intramembrane serine protease [Myxococcales bacterium]|nr:rhomboid family intramembrane serine protease [Myxococcales bacterium]
MAAAVLRVRTDRGEERLDLEEFEAKVVRGEIAPQCPVLFPAVTGDAWVAAGSLEIFKQLYSPRRLHFSRAFSLGGVPRVTFAFLAANVLWFVAAQIWPSPDPSDTLLRFGAKAGPLMLDLGQFWRLLTANVVHKDALHIAVNLFVIFNFAGALENAFRPLDMALILAASGLGTTLCSFAATDPVSAGASGVAYGALGGAVVFGFKYRDILPARYRMVLGGAVVPTVLVFLFIGWTSSGVDNWGHLGGLAAGSATVALLKPRMLTDPPKGLRLVTTRLLPLAVILGGPVVASALAPPFLPPLVVQTDRDLGFAVPVPVEWERGADRLGPMAFYDGLSGYGHAQLSAGGFLSDGPLDMTQVATNFIEGELRTPAASGRISALEVGPVTPAQAAGLEGKRIDATFRRGGLSLRLEALLLRRGRLCYELEAIWPQDLPQYQRVFSKIEAGLAVREPAFLTRARSRALYAPGSPDAQAELADALSAVAP